MEWILGKHRLGRWRAARWLEAPFGNEFLIKIAGYCFGRIATEEWTMRMVVEWVQAPQTQ